MGTNLIEDDGFNAACHFGKLFLPAGRVCENDPEEDGRLTCRIRSEAVVDTNGFFAQLAECLGNLVVKLRLMHKTGRNHWHAPIIAGPERKASFVPEFTG